MDKTILVAIVTGLSGLVVAIIAMFQNARTSRIQSETHKYVEELKVLSELRYKSIVEASSKTEPVIKALDGAWKDMQVIKDCINVLKSPIHIRSNEHIDKLHDSVNNLVKNYSAHGASLPDVAARIWHEAKNQAIAYRSGILARIDEINKNERLSEEDVMWFRDIHQSLTDYQCSIKEWKENYREQEIDIMFEHLKPNKTNSADAKKRLC